MANPPDDEDEERAIITLETLTPEQWIEIRRIALKIFDSKRYGTDQLKCAVAAFAAWISTQEGDFACEDPGPDWLH
jgi:hypothetical protein